MLPHTPRSTLFPYTTLFRSEQRILIQAETKSLQDSRPVDVSLNVYMCLDSHNSFNSEAASLVTVQRGRQRIEDRSEEHTSELQSRGHLVCRLLLEKKNDRKF